MTIIQTSDFVAPNDPETIRKIKNLCQELSASFTRIEGEKSFIKEAIEEISKDTDIPKKFLNRIAKFYHKSNKDEVTAEQEASNELYDRIFSEQVSQE